MEDSIKKSKKKFSSFVLIITQFIVFAGQNGKKENFWKPKP